MVKKVIAGLLLFATSGISVAGDNAWIRKWEQGETQYFIGNEQGARLYISCRAGTNAFVEYTAPGGKTASSADSGHDIHARVDSGREFLVSDTQSDAGGGNFEAFWRALRKGQQVTVTSAGLPAATFTFSGIKKVLPDLSRSECLTRQ